MIANAFSGESVLITGHTGFKGSWLSHWLVGMGARVVGYSLPEMPTNPSLFEHLRLENQLDHRTGDVRDYEKLSATIREAKPRFVFHLAAQPLVRLSYQEPRETFQVNVQGTVNLLDSLRGLRQPCVAVIVTTDKCYENKEWIYPYRENEAMGGHDPYSASKGCAELVTSAYRRSFFDDGESFIATARAGNVIGGGDWATDRIVPDCLRAIDKGESIPVRNRHATRPWQHVLEPLSGYLTLAEAMEHARKAGNQSRMKQLTSGFNFGPELDANRTVADLVAELANRLGGKWHDASDPNAPHEASRLNLAIEKAWHILGWRPTWDFEHTIGMIAQWHKRTTDGETVGKVVTDQIQEFTRDCRFTAGIS